MSELTRCGFSWSTGTHAHACNRPKWHSDRHYCGGCRERGPAVPVGNPERTVAIVKRRDEGRLTLQEIGDEFYISRERVRQLYEKAKRCAGVPHESRTIPAPRAGMAPNEPVD